jgi:hypothetical protein
MMPVVSVDPASLNRENLDRLIAALEAAPDEKFEMRDWFSWDDHDDQDDDYDPTCATAACLAGWAGWLSGLAGDPTKEIDDYIAWLGIKPGSRADDELCTPDYCREKTRLQAIAVLKHLRDTGEVNWSRFGRDGADLHAMEAA